MGHYDKLAREIRELRREVRSGSQANQAAHTSIEDGAISSYDRDGNLRLRIGAQEDGTQAAKYVQGPPPPRPAAPVVSVDGPVVRVRWDGILMGGHIPEDFARIDVHFALASDDLEDQGAVKGNLATVAGNETVLAATETGSYRVGLVAVSQSRARSEMSDTVEVEVTLVDLEGALDAVVDNARGGSNHYTPEPPAGTDHDPDRDLWFDTSEDDDGLVHYTAHRWDEDAQEWVSIGDQRTQAIQDAQREFEQSTSQALSDVQQAASGAQSAADAAAEAAGTALSTAETARDEAESKANAAQAAAEAHAEAVAEAERLAAIAAASDDASAKAAAAEAAAKAEAAQDASAKADAARAAAEAKAQAAQDAADAAQSSADDARSRADAAHSAAGSAADAADAAMQAATHNAKNMWSTENPSGTAPRGTIWFKIDPATKNVVGQWQQTAGSDTSFGSNWEKRSLTDALFDNIDAGKIGTGYLDVAKLIRAGAIQADKLLIGSAGNMIPTNPDPAINDFPFVHWDEGEQASRANGRGTHYTNTAFTLPAGRYRMTVDMKASVEGTRSYIGIYHPTPRWNYGINNQLLTTEWETYSGTLIVTEANQVYPYTLRYLPAYSGDIDAVTWFRNLRLQSMVGSTLIEPESINTPHLAAGSITGESGILSNLDAGVITYGFMSGARLEAGSVDTPQLSFGAATGDILSADALNFKTARGMEIIGSTFRAGDSVEITEEYGIRQFGPDGALNISLPSDGSEAFFRGDLSARTLTATGRMSVQGPGAIASGGVLELESGVVPPATPPDASAYVEHTTFPPVEANESPVGLAWADGSWWRAVNVEGTREGDRIERISPTGERLTAFPTHGDPRGLTTIGNELFLLANKWDTTGQDRWVFVYDLSGNLKRSWEYTHYGTGKFQPGIGTNGTDILIAQCWADGLLSWRRYNRTTGALLQQVDTTDKFNSDVTGLYAGNGDFGAARVLVSRPTGYVSVFNNAVWIPTESWRSPAGHMTGFDYVNGRFHQATMNDGTLIAYSTRTVETDGDLNEWWIAATWASNTAETPAGPARRFTFLRRSDLRITLGTPPEGASLARVYLARKATEPSRSDFHLIGEGPADAEQVTVVLPTDWGQQPSPPAANTFEASTPGLIRSTLGKFQVDGTGAGRWGPLVFHPDGSMSSDQVPEWIPITSFKTGFGPQSWGFVPAYRIWPDGKVEWRGVVAGNVEGTAEAFTVPDAARPTHPVNLVATTNSVGGHNALTRIEFGQLNTPDVLRIYRGAFDRTWFSLDGVFYYLD